MNNRIKLVIEALEDLEINSPETRFEMARIIAIQELKKMSNSEWVPCKVRLPEEFGCYLVAWRPTDLTAEDIIKNTGSSPHYYEILAFEPVFGGGWIDDIEQCDEYEILAWQPLPEPYKEAEND
jgi:hypothetical protein